MACFIVWYKLLLPADYLLFRARILVKPRTCYGLLIIPRTGSDIQGIPLKFQRGIFYFGFHKIENSQTTMSHTTHNPVTPVSATFHIYAPLSTTTTTHNSEPTHLATT